MTYNELPAWLKRIVSAHRGYGLRQNSLRAVQDAVEAGFSMVEFDVQYYDGEFVLGHPPYIGDQTLEQALGCFEHTQCLPKIDVKLTSADITPTHIQKLVDSLGRVHGERKLVNLSHKHTLLEPSQYFKAEALFCQAVKASKQSNIFLNVDISRYQETSNAVIITHIRALKPFVYSMSLEMKHKDQENAYKIAKACGIHRLQFWLHQERYHRTNLQELETFYHNATGKGFEPAFDIDIRHQILPA